MKVYRLIEYEIPDDYSPEAANWLERTLTKSIRGAWRLDRIGATITAAEIPSDDHGAVVSLLHLIDEARARVAGAPEGID